MLTDRIQFKHEVEWVIPKKLWTTNKWKMNTSHKPNSREEMTDRCRFAEINFNDESTHLEDYWYGEREESMTNEKTRMLKILEEQHHENMKNFVKNYESDSQIKIKWNSDHTLNFKRGIRF